MSLEQVTAQVTTEIMKQHAATNGNGKKPEPPQKKPLVELMSSVEEEDLDFIWTNRIPRGKITLFDGDPGVGKSYTALAVAAALSRGDPLPYDRSPEAPLRTLIIAPEDGPSDTIKKRLRLLNADQSLIAIPSRALNFTPSQINASLIEQFLKEHPAALIIIDPIIALAGSRNTDRASDVRNMLGPLAMLAERHKAAMILIRHLNKGTQSKALYRGQGSIDFAGICRSAFIFAEDPQDPTRQRRLMCHSKFNLVGMQPTLEFFIDGSGLFRWGAESLESADEALGTGEPTRHRERVQMDKASEFLRDMLKNGSVSSVKLEEEAEKQGLRRAIWRAKSEMGIKATKGLGGRFFWSLPNGHEGRDG